MLKTTAVLLLAALTGSGTATGPKHIEPLIKADCIRAELQNEEVDAVLQGLGIDPDKAAIKKKLTISEFNPDGSLKKETCVVDLGVTELIQR
jgi:hypothetical protein